MAKPIRYKDGTLLMPGSRAMKLHDRIFKNRHRTSES